MCRMITRVRLALAAAVLAPAAALAQPTGDLVVLNKGGDTAQIVSMPAAETTATLATGRGPHEAAISPDGRWAVAANYEDPAASTLTVYDLRTRQTERVIDLGDNARPHGLAFIPGTPRLAVTCEGVQQLAIVNIESGDTEARIDTDARGSHMVAVTPDGARAFVPNLADGTVSVIDLARGSLVKIIETAPGAEGVAVTPDGTEVWITNRAAGSISIIDAASLEVLETIACPGFPIRCAVTPDGERVLVSCATAGVVAEFDRASREELRRIATRGADQPAGLAPIGLLIVPAGTHAFAANAADGDVAVIDLGTGAVIQRIAAGDNPDGMAFLDRDREVVPMDGGPGEGTEGEGGASLE